MNQKRTLLLSCFLILAACSPKPNLTTPISAGATQADQVKTPTATATLGETFMLTPTNLPTNTQVEEEEDKMTGAIFIPSGNTPTIDGTMSPGEWDRAAVEKFSDGSQLFLMQSGSFLFLGVKVNEPQMVAGNIYVKQAEDISVLHTSAALGTAIFKKTDSAWQKIQDFTWRCRNTSNSESAQAERKEFLQQEGWLAANGRMGTPNELEYQIKIPDQDFQLAVVFTRSTYPYEKKPWPVDLDDACIQPTPGGFPEMMDFSPDQWAVLDLSR